MKKPIAEPLPGDLLQLEDRWPKELAAIMAKVRSPENPEKIAGQLRADQQFMNLINGWEDMPTAAQANAWEMILERLFEAALASRAYCLRCGECCRLGSPVIYDQDRIALASGHLKRSDLVTYRRGEKAWSNRQGRLISLESEHIKVREAPGSRACVFLSPGEDACLIYEHRPHQCRIMECWDPSRFDTVITLPPVTRQDLLGPGNPLAEIMDRHDERCDVANMAAALEKEGGPGAADLEAVLDMILFDLHVREFVLDRLSLGPEELEFLFGRPLALICRDFGYDFKPNSDGPPELVPSAPAGPGD